MCALGGFGWDLRAYPIATNHNRLASLSGSIPALHSQFDLKESQLQFIEPSRLRLHRDNRETPPQPWPQPREYRQYRLNEMINSDYAFFFTGVLTPRPTRSLVDVSPQNSIRKKNHVLTFSSIRVGSSVSTSRPLSGSVLLLMSCCQSLTYPR